VADVIDEVGVVNAHWPVSSLPCGSSMQWQSLFLSMPYSLAFLDKAC